MRNRLARLEFQSAVGKDPRKMTDQELDTEIARLRRICVDPPDDTDSEIDAEIARLTQKLYPTTDHQGPSEINEQAN